MLIYLLLWISLMDAMGFGIWNLFTALRNKHEIQHYTNEPVRSFDQLFIFVPALNEVQTIEGTVNQLLASLSQLPIKATLVVIDDASSDGTTQKLCQLSRRDGLKVIFRRFPNAQKGKGMALNDALRWVEAERTNPQRTIIGVIDSDSQPDAVIVNRIYQAFTHSNYDLIQTGIGICNQNSFLTRMQAFEFQVANYLEQLLRMDFGSAIASGNGQFMTLKMASKVRWRASLLDDLEFSINGLFNGYYGGFLPEVLMPQEGVTSYGALIKQRTRWCQGGMQCLFHYGRKIFVNGYIPARLKANLILFMLIPFGSMLFSIGAFVSLAIMGTLLFYNYQETAGIVVSVIVFSLLTSETMLVAATRMHKGGYQSFKLVPSLKMALGNFLYVWLLIPVPFISFWRLSTGQNNWVKTAHTVVTSDSRGMTK